MVSVPHGKLAIFHHHLGEDVGWNFFLPQSRIPPNLVKLHPGSSPMQFSTPISRRSGDHDPLSGGNSQILFHVQPKKLGKMKPF